MARWTSTLVIAALVCAGCEAATPSPSLHAPAASGSPAISAETAIAAALKQQESSTPPKVLSARLSTYGAEADGAGMAPAGTLVWAILLSGTFRGPCGGVTASPQACPSSMTTEMILIDAGTGAYIQGEIPAP